MCCLVLSVTTISQAASIALVCGRGFRVRAGDPMTAYMENLYSEATVGGRKRETVALKDVAL